MTRIATRLTLSHVLVVVVGAVVTFLLTRALAPALYDRFQRGPRSMQGPNIRQQMIEAVDLALLVGALSGIAVAALLGWLVAARFTRPIRDLQTAARVMASGHYEMELPTPPERELADLARDLQALGDSLASTEARRVELLGDVAHELRTPLTIIGGYVEGMSDGVVAADPEHLALIGREVERMRRLSDDLVALSRAQETGLDLRVETFDLGAVTEETVERLQPQARDADVALVVEQETAPIDGDPGRVGQVVTNLVGNALKAVGPGGHIEVACRRVGDMAVVTVADDGEGLARDDLERVFERFYRVERRQGDERGGGSGIGLTIARQIARAHGGDLLAASPGPGRGSTFTLSLPVARR